MSSFIGFYRVVVGLLRVFYRVFRSLFIGVFIGLL